MKTQEDILMNDNMFYFSSTCASKGNSLIYTPPQTLLCQCLFIDIFQFVRVVILILNFCLIKVVNFTTSKT